MRYLLSFFVLIVAMMFIVPAFAATQDAQVTFTAPTVNASSVTGYKIERCTGVNCTAFTQVGTTNATTLTFTDPGLLQGTVYCYREIATSALGDSAPSPPGCNGTAGIPGAPGAPTVSIILK